MFNRRKRVIFLTVIAINLAVLACSLADRLHPLPHPPRSRPWSCRRWRHKSIPRRRLPYQAERSPWSLPKHS